MCWIGLGKFKRNACVESVWTMLIEVKILLFKIINSVFVGVIADKFLAELILGVSVMLGLVN